MRNKIWMAIAVALAFTALPAMAKEKYKVAWSIYVGWMPWDYAGHSGVLKKWADKYDIDIELIRMDYIPSVEAYVSEQIDACVMTNMECLDMPAASGIDSTVIIVGDYSNGNDAILTRNDVDIQGLKGKQVSLVELSVSHYLLARCLEKNNIKERDVSLINTSDSDIGPIFISDTSQEVVITWNPIVMEIEQTPGVNKIFTSADIPGEIIDMMVVRSKVMEKSDKLAKALTGAWYEVMDTMSKRGADAEKALAVMANSAGCSTVEFKNQLKTTAMFYNAQAAVDYTRSDELKEKMDLVRQFCFRYGLLGENARSVDVVGIAYPDGSVQGDKSSIGMRYDATFMQLAAEGKL